MIPVGKMVLDRNPKNYFAEVEQIAFSPAHMPPGVEASPDKMLQVTLKDFFFVFYCTSGLIKINRAICKHLVMSDNVNGL